MRVLIVGDAVNITTYYDGKLDVACVRPHFNVHVDNISEIEEIGGILNNKFLEQFGTKLITDDKDEFSVACHELTLIKNDNGIDCILCTLADRFESPCLVEFVPNPIKQGMEMQAESRYKAVVFDALGNVYGFTGLAKEGGNFTFKSHWISNAPAFDKHLDAKDPAILNVINKLKLCSNLGTWYSI